MDSVFVTKASLRSLYHTLRNSNCATVDDCNDCDDVGNNSDACGNDTAIYCHVKRHESGSDSTLNHPPRNQPTHLTHSQIPFTMTALLHTLNANHCGCHHNGVFYNTTHMCADRGCTTFLEFEKDDIVMMFKAKYHKKVLLVPPALALNIRSLCLNHIRSQKN